MSCDSHGECRGLSSVEKKLDQFRAETKVDLVRVHERIDTLSGLPDKVDGIKEAVKASISLHISEGMQELTAGLSDRIKIEADERVDYHVSKYARRAIVAVCVFVGGGSGALLMAFWDKIIERLVS